MIRAEVDGDRLTHDELLGLTATMLMAGTDTTRNQLAAAVQVFCDHPDKWALLAEHPDLAPQAVHEVTRYSPIIFTTMRTAVEDVELAGFRFPAGTLVIANTAAANRDPAMYPGPDRFDITRADAPAMLTFGGGIHYCLGAHLARIELAEALTTMGSRMPDMRFSGSVPWKSMTGISGPASLRLSSQLALDPVAPGPAVRVVYDPVCGLRP
jgi:cytochrome P450